MAISNQQFITWAHQGAIAQSRDTYASVKRALESSSAAYSRRQFRVFLQGSYGNDTNIYRESDVDVVIICYDVYYHEYDLMTEPERQAFDGSRIPPDYLYDDFKRDVVSALVAAFGSDVYVGPKAIHIRGQGNRRNADVIAGFENRRYFSFKRRGDENYASGLVFWTQAGMKIVNYPELHSANMTAKHQSTLGHLKPFVRILKNMRTKLVESGRLPDGVAPSYFIEGLLYNVPNDRFRGTYADTFQMVRDWLASTDRSEFEVANRQFYLLRDYIHNCWPPANCQRFLDALSQMWNSGG